MHQQTNKNFPMLVLGPRFKPSILDMGVQLFILYLCIKRAAHNCCGAHMQSNSLFMSHIHKEGLSWAKKKMKIYKQKKWLSESLD